MHRAPHHPNPHAAPLRADPPPAERRLWSHLRNRQLQNAKFRRQHSIGPYIADFACIEANLVIELDGAQHAQAETADAHRTAFLESKGWTVIRFWNARVLTDLPNVLVEIATHLPK